MARKKLQEYQAKKLLFSSLGFPYDGIRFTDRTSYSSFASDKLSVLKVDQGIKGRFKKGLVALKVAKKDIPRILSNWQQKGFQHFLLEEWVEHKREEERFLAVERVRGGLLLIYGLTGGVDVEDQQDSLRKELISDTSQTEHIAKYLGLKPWYLIHILKTFEEEYFSFLEINPFIVRNNRPYLLDCAVEVDSAAEFFTKNAWTKNDFVEEESLYRAEKKVAEIASRSQASLTLSVLNPNGSLFMLLSGGGASLVLADEAYNLGFGRELANYGEYSGNPTEEETYLYAQNILELMLKSSALSKALVIAGGVANFTDIPKTFKGIMRALKENSQEMRKQKIKVFVRRGGPNEKEGLSQMEKFLKEEDLYGLVADSRLPLPEIVKKALASLKKNA